ncbi:NAD-dependent epimerase/dehydratase family protein [Gallaecimonas mangrovi]|uniref:NAD-dependent epimerase/dehydratase family protein n=1 Tax=Gallaecimonas mangrovi TaxID=2291597 RepID=UPI000E1FFA07|nr:NAD-dependent epimerase/dehydratase family protein [Gallaecimonas mangrovi]
MSKKALVLGATGGIGSEVAKALLQNGWQVVAMARHIKTSDDGIVWRQGDAMDQSAVAKAAEGCAVIVHAVNPPGYKNWQTLLPVMFENTLAAAKAQGAAVLLPGNVYNYGPDSFPLISEQSPQHPLSGKGKVRVQMEQRLDSFVAQGGRAIVVRAGDFFGPKAGNNWFAQLVQPGKAVSRVLNPGKVGHQWAYLPDLAKTMVVLVERRQQLPGYACFNFAGHWDSSGQQMANAIAEVVQRERGQRPPIKAFPWWLVPLLGVFNATFREVQEMRYLWQQEVRLDNSKLLAFLGEEPHTALDEAVASTLKGLGCL